jgi:carbamoyl-phosphate synthase/aspartate carbamoyltransferase
MKHILDVSQFTRKMVDSLIHNAHKMKTIISSRGIYDVMHGRTLISLYYEPSTRTMCSFQSAMIKLGGNNIFIADKYSSVEKGESLEDTIKTLNCYGSAIVLRHPEKGSSQIAASVSNVPIINAGDGNGEHPTQALLDVYTIYSELGDIGGKVPYLPMRILFMGDLKNSRTIHSLTQLLCLYDNLEFIYISPKGLEMPSELVEKINSCGIKQTSHYHLLEAVSIADVLYVTRIQKERFASENAEDARNLSMQYQITPKIMGYAKPNAILMHPFPRNDEITCDVDTDPRAVYFKQMQYGLYMRMAILEWVMKY